MKKEQDISRYQEKQKTLRLLIVIVAFFLLAGAGILVLHSTQQGHEGNLELDLSNLKLSLNIKKPLVEQINVSNVELEGSSHTTSFTKGKITDQHIVKQIEKFTPSNNSFSGKNFISHQLGFLFSAPFPQRWDVQFNPNGLKLAYEPVYLFRSNDGSNLAILVSSISPEISIDQFVTLNIDNMRKTGVLADMPKVTYDYPSETAFAVFTNPYTRGESYQKVIIDRITNRVFVASANYNYSLSSPETMSDLIEMITTFTLF